MDVKHAAAMWCDAAFTPELDAALKRVIDCKGNADGNLVSDEKLSVCRKNAMEGDVSSKPSFHDTLSWTPVIG
jgi:hypothetical protein